MSIKPFFLHFAFVVFLSFLTACPSKNKTTDTPGPDDVIFEIEVTYPRFVDQPQYVATEGTFNVSDQLTVKAPYRGTIEKVFVSEGDHVNVGDPLCLFDAAHLNAQIEVKQAELKESETELEALQQNQGITGTTTGESEQGQETIFLDDEITDQPPQKPKEAVENPPSNTEEAKKEVAEKIKLLETKIQRLNKELDQLGLELQSQNVTAKLAGVIQTRHITEGSLVTENENLFEIVATDPISMIFYVPQKVSSYVDKLIQVKAHPEESPEMIMEGTIYYISPALDAENKGLEVKIHLPNEKGLFKAGQKGKALVSTRKVDKVLLIPQKALLQEGEFNYVFVAKGNKAQKIKINLGETTENEEIAIEGSLRIDDAIIISTPNNLHDGSFIKVIKEIPAPQTSAVQP